MSLDGANLNFVNAAGILVEYAAKGRKFSVGSFLGCDLVLPDAERVHCEIQCDAFGRVTIYNHSCNEPVLLNDQVVHATSKRPLFHGARIKILNDVYTWNFPRSDEHGTPDRAPPEQAPNSSPTVKGHRQRRQFDNRLTVHKFRYSINSDDEGNTSIESRELETSASCHSAEISTAAESVCTNESPSKDADETLPKVDLLEATQNKENTSTLGNKLMLQMCARSDIVITSFSPRETGVKIEKSFTCVMKPTTVMGVSISATPKSVYNTPKGVLSELNEDSSSRDVLEYSTPSTSKEVLSGKRPSSMYLIDLTTPQRLRPTLGATPKQTPGSQKSGITPADSTDESSDVSVILIDTSCSTAPSSTPAKGQPRKVMKTPKEQLSAAGTTPKRTPQSLMKRALLTSAKKQILGNLRTPKTPQDVPNRQSIIDSRRQCLTAPRRLPFHPHPQWRTSVRRQLPGVDGRETAQTSLRKRQSLSLITPRDNKISKIRKSLAVNAKISPTVGMSNKLVAKARRALNSPKQDSPKRIASPQRILSPRIDTPNSKHLESFEPRQVSTPDKASNSNAELSQTFTIDDDSNATGLASKVLEEEADRKSSKLFPDSMPADNNSEKNSSTNEANVETVEDKDINEQKDASESDVLNRTYELNASQSKAVLETTTAEVDQWFKPNVGNVSSKVTNEVGEKVEINATQLNKSTENLTAEINDKSLESSEAVDVIEDNICEEVPTTPTYQDQEELVTMLRLAEDTICEEVPTSGKDTPVANDNADPEDGHGEEVVAPPGETPRPRRSSRRLSSQATEVPVTTRHSLRRASIDAQIKLGQYSKPTRRASCSAAVESQPIAALATPRRKRRLTEEASTPTRKSQRLLCNTPKRELPVDDSVGDMGVIIEEDGASVDKLPTVADEDYGSELPDKDGDEPDKIDYQGMRELLKTPKSCSTPHFKGLREMIRTPKVHPSPMLGNIDELLETPSNDSSTPKRSVTVSRLALELTKTETTQDQYFKTPRGKNLMIPNNPASAVLKSMDKSLATTTEYDLNATNATPKLDKIFDDVLSADATDPSIAVDDSETEINVTAISTVTDSEPDPLSTTTKIVEPSDTVRSEDLMSVAFADTSRNDPLTSTAYKKGTEMDANQSEIYEEESKSPGICDVSGIQMLDRTTDSMFSEPLILSRADSLDLTLEETKASPVVNLADKSNKTEVVENYSDSDSMAGLAEPLILSDDDTDAEEVKLDTQKETPEIQSINNEDVPVKEELDKAESSTSEHLSRDEQNLVEGNSIDLTEVKCDLDCTLEPKDKQNLGAATDDSQIDSELAIELGSSVTAATDVSLVQADSATSTIYGADLSQVNQTPTQDKAGGEEDSIIELDASIADTISLDADVGSGNQDSKLSAELLAKDGNEDNNKPEASEDSQTPLDAINTEKPEKQDISNLEVSQNLQNLSNDNEARAPKDATVEIELNASRDVTPDELSTKAAESSFSNDSIEDGGKSKGNLSETEEIPDKVTVVATNICDYSEVNKKEEESPPEQPIKDESIVKHNSVTYEADSNQVEVQQDVALILQESASQDESIIQAEIKESNAAAEEKKAESDQESMEKRDVVEIQESIEPAEEMNAEPDKESAENKVVIGNEEPNESAQDKKAESEKECVEKSDSIEIKESNEAVEEINAEKDKESVENTDSIDIKESNEAAEEKKAESDQESMEKRDVVEIQESIEPAEMNAEPDKESVEGKDVIEMEEPNESAQVKKADSDKESMEKSGSIEIIKSIEAAEGNKGESMEKSDANELESTSEISAKPVEDAFSNLDSQPNNEIEMPSDDINTVNGTFVPEVITPSEESLSDSKDNSCILTASLVAENDNIGAEASNISSPVAEMPSMQDEIENVTQGDLESNIPEISPSFTNQPEPEEKEILSTTSTEPMEENLSGAIVEDSNIDNSLVELDEEKTKEDDDVACLSEFTKISSSQNDIGNVTQVNLESTNPDESLAPEPEQLENLSTIAPVPDDEMISEAVVNDSNADDSLVEDKMEEEDAVQMLPASSETPTNHKDVKEKSSDECMISSLGAFEKPSTKANDEDTMKHLVKAANTDNSMDLFNESETDDEDAEVPTQDDCDKQTEREVKSPTASVETEPEKSGVQLSNISTKSLPESDDEMKSGDVDNPTDDVDESQTDNESANRISSISAVIQPSPNDYDDKPETVLETTSADEDVVITDASIVVESKVEAKKINEEIVDISQSLENSPNQDEPESKTHAEVNSKQDEQSDKEAQADSDASAKKETNTPIKQVPKALLGSEGTQGKSQSQNESVSEQEALEESSGPEVLSTSILDTETQAASGKESGSEAPLEPEADASEVMADRSTTPENSPMEINYSKQETDVECLEKENSGIASNTTADESALGKPDSGNENVMESVADEKEQKSPMANCTEQTADTKSSDLNIEKEMPLESTPENNESVHTESKETDSEKPEQIESMVQKETIEDRRASNEKKSPKVQSIDEIEVIDLDDSSSENPSEEEGLNTGDESNLQSVEMNLKEESGKDNAGEGKSVEVVTIDDDEDSDQEIQRTESQEAADQTKTEGSKSKQDMETEPPMTHDLSSEEKSNVEKDKVSTQKDEDQNASSEEIESAAVGTEASKKPENFITSDDKSFTQDSSKASLVLESSTSQTTENTHSGQTRKVPDRKPSTLIEDDIIIVNKHIIKKANTLEEQKGELSVDKDVAPEEIMNAAPSHVEKEISEDKSKRRRQKSTSKEVETNKPMDSDKPKRRGRKRTPDETEATNKAAAEAELIDLTKPKRRARKSDVEVPATVEEHIGNKEPSTLELSTETPSKEEIQKNVDVEKPKRRGRKPSAEVVESDMKLDLKKHKKVETKSSLEENSEQPHGMDNPRRRGRKSSVEIVEAESGAQEKPGQVEDSHKTSRKGRKPTEVEDTEGKADDLLKSKRRLRKATTEVVEIEHQLDKQKEKDSKHQDEPDDPKRQVLAAQVVDIETEKKIILVKPGRRGRKPTTELVEVEEKGEEAAEHKRRGRNPAAHGTKPEAPPENIQETTGPAEEESKEKPKRRYRKASSEVTETSEPAEPSLPEKKSSRKTRKASAETVEDEKASNVHLAVIDELDEPDRKKSRLPESQDLDLEPHPVKGRGRKPSASVEVAARGTRAKSSTRRGHKAVVDEVPTESAELQPKRLGRKASADVAHADGQPMEPNERPTGRGRKPSTETGLEPKADLIADKKTSRRLRKPSANVEIIVEEAAQAKKTTVQRRRKASISAAAEEADKELDMQSLPTPSVESAIVVSAAVSPKPQVLSSEDELTPRRREGRNLPRKNYDETSDEDKPSSRKGRKPAASKTAGTPTPKPVESDALALPKPSTPLPVKPSDLTVEPAVEPSTPVTTIVLPDQSSSQKREGRNMPRKNYSETSDDEKPSTSRGRRVRQPTIKALEQLVVDSATRPATPKRKLAKAKTAEPVDEHAVEPPEKKVTTEAIPVASKGRAATRRKAHDADEVAEADTIAPVVAKRGGRNRKESASSQPEEPVVEVELKQPVKRNARGANSRKAKAAVDEVTDEQPAEKKPRGRGRAKTPVVVNAEKVDVAEKPKEGAAAKRERPTRAVKIANEAETVQETVTPSRAGRGRKVHFETTEEVKSAAKDEQSAPAADAPKRATRSRRK